MLNIIVGFRESLEAILIIFIIYKVLKLENKNNLKKYLYQGVVAGIALSILVVFFINGLESVAVNYGKIFEKSWEVIASFTSAVLVFLLVKYMIKNSSSITSSTKEQTKNNLSPIGIFVLTSLMIAREGFEIVLFTFNSTSSNVLFQVILGIILGVLFGFLINYSIINISLKTVFKVITIYLILQVGYLLGYAVREFIALLEVKEVLLNSTLIYGRMFDFSGTILDSSNSLIGILLNATVGWKSNPFILQFITQYVTTIYLFIVYNKKKGA